MCEGRGLAARLQRVMRVHTVHTAGVPPLLLLGMRRQAEEVLDGPAKGGASQERACAMGQGPRAERARDAEPRCGAHLAPPSAAMSPSPAQATAENRYARGSVHSPVAKRVKRVGSSANRA